MGDILEKSRTVSRLSPAMIPLLSLCLKEKEKVRWNATVCIATANGGSPTALDLCGSLCKRCINGNLDLHCTLSPKELIDKSNEGTGVCCNLLSFYTNRIYRTAFDAKTAAIRIALSRLLSHTDRVSKVVILSNSRVALQAISSIEAPISVVISKC
ncbi:hypothetical protein TNCV_2236621 [Trichonephila clavipes]|nr:hypothetical protein TNCV_2236621 [Trichonephila clavipes]